MKITEPGIYVDVSAADYFADPCPEPSFTQSIGKVLIAQSAWHARTEHPRLTPPLPAEDEETEKYVVATAIGNAAHKLIIGRGKDIAVGDFKAWRGTDPQNFKNAALAAGRVPILTKHMARAYAMEKAFRDQLKHHEEGDVFTAGKGEVVLAWQEDGFWFRCMVDWLHDDLLAADDLKTTGLSAAPHSLGMLAVNAGWDIQGAMIERGLDVLHPETAGRRKIRFVPLENYQPFALSVMPMDEHWLTMGRKKLEFAITQWKICMARKHFPGYPHVGVTPVYPGFKEVQWLDREIAHEHSKPEMPHDILMAG
jgi:hypothetical protein